ncbi:trimeric LpxA-like protein [Aspergillus ellipticus CBS 707.79]|uniref:Trimeric LpxA-like protein n=1 Tax=Aspergillus ellipticus CBS 707.79 TaxID=1448320 RepID=A0A319CT86_9EURO|nr:trimeric LpxA-like protein [Aspergillus ellipticus CBS 707.79]
MLSNIDEKENLARMRRGDLYYAFSPELVAARKRCARVVSRLNNSGELTRREIAQFWAEITDDQRLLPPPTLTDEEEDAVLHEYPWIERPINIDYGTNIKVGSGVFINFNCTFLDTCLISIGSRTLVGSNVSFFSASHPLDPDLRNGTNGPELGKPITIGEDCWIGGNATILPGDVPAYHVVAGNPARIIRKVERKFKAEQEQQNGLSSDNVKEQL